MFERAFEIRQGPSSEARFLQYLSLLFFLLLLCSKGARTHTVFIGREITRLHWVLSNTVFFFFFLSKGPSFPFFSYF